MEDGEEPDVAGLTERMEGARVPAEGLVRPLLPAPDAVLGWVEFPSLRREFHLVGRWERDREACLHEIPADGGDVFPLGTLHATSGAPQEGREVRHATDRTGDGGLGGMLGGFTGHPAWGHVSQQEAWARCRTRGGTTH